MADSSIAANELPTTRKRPALVWLISLLFGIGGTIGLFVNLAALLGFRFATSLRPDSYGPSDFFLFLMVSGLSLAVAVSLFRLRGIAWQLICLLLIADLAVFAYGTVTHSERSLIGGVFELALILLLRGLPVLYVLSLRRRNVLLE